MPTQTFNDFFAGVRMTLLAAAAVAKNAAPRVLPDAFYTPGPTKPYNDQVQFPVVTWSRAGATVIARNSPPRAVNLGKRDFQVRDPLQHEGGDGSGHPVPRSPQQQQPTRERRRAASP
jgi:hypothetical protein